MPYRPTLEFIDIESDVFPCFRTGAVQGDDLSLVQISYYSWVTHPRQWVTTWVCGTDLEPIENWPHRGDHRIESIIQRGVESLPDMWTFHFERTEDITGASGIGRVAEGVIFSDGSVAIRWCSDTPSTVVWGSIDHAIRIHGHGNRTRLILHT